MGKIREFFAVYETTPAAEEYMQIVKDYHSSLLYNPEIIFCNSYGNAMQLTLDYSVDDDAEGRYGFDYWENYFKNHMGDQKLYEIGYKVIEATEDNIFRYKYSYFFTGIPTLYEWNESHPDTWSSPYLEIVIQADEDDYFFKNKDLAQEIDNVLVDMSNAFSIDDIPEKPIYNRAMLSGACYNLIDVDEFDEYLQYLFYRLIENYDLDVKIHANFITDDPKSFKVARVSTDEGYIKWEICDF